MEFKETDGNLDSELDQHMKEARWDFGDKLLMYGVDVEHPAIKNHPYLQALRILAGDSEAK